MHIPSRLPSIRALGWDLDGTLYPPSQTLTKLIQKRQYQAVSEKMRWSLQRTRSEYEKRYLNLGSNTKTISSFGIDGISFFTSAWDTIDLSVFIHRDERMVHMFDSLASRRHFLISNSNRLDQIQKKLLLIGLQAEIFEVIVPTEELGEVKPDPAPFLFALEKLRLPPEQTLFIGDRVSTDVMGASAVGMRTCRIGETTPSADICIPSVYDILLIFSDR